MYENSCIHSGLFEFIWVSNFWGKDFSFIWGIYKVSVWVQSILVGITHLTFLNKNLYSKNLIP